MMTGVAALALAGVPSAATAPAAVPSQPSSR